MSFALIAIASGRLELAATLVSCTAFTCNYVPVHGSVHPCFAFYSNLAQQGFGLTAQLDCAFIAAALAQMQHTLQWHAAL